VRICNCYTFSYFFVAYLLLRHMYDQSLTNELTKQCTTNRLLKYRIFNLSKYISPILSKSIIAGNHVHVDAIDKPVTVFFPIYKVLASFLNN
jgi:hypothetical protein